MSGRASVRHGGLGGARAARPLAPTSWETPKGVSWNTPTAAGKEGTAPA